MKDADGDVYEGEFKDDKRNGYGVLVHPGFKYEGEFKDDMMWGKGKQYFPGYTMTGTWEKNIPVGEVILTFPDGREMEVSVKDGLPVIEEK